jgi:PTH1 family peptidyl-tRNA hydrolase
MMLVAGLGNPGAQYANTRHNVGFDTIDYLAASYRIPLNRVRHKALTGEGIIQGRKVMLIKPQTFMNLSGEAISELVRFYKVPPADLIVIYDDIDLAVGRVRVRPGGSAGTHNGMRSIVERLGTTAFPRVRIGVGKPPPGWKLADFVLSRFSGEERPLVNEAVERAADAVPAILLAGAEATMSRYNG